MPLYGFGSGKEGELGDRLARDPSTPKIIPLHAASDLAQVSCGSHHTLFLFKDGSVYASGRGYSNEGNGDEEEQPALKLMKGLSSKQVLSVSCGAEHSVAVTNGGHLFAWGSNTSGQLGVSNTTKNDQSSTPMMVNLSEVVQAVCGSEHTLAMTSDGCLYAWGSNSHGQLGIGSHTAERRPHSVRSLAGVPLKSLAAGEFHSAAVSESGAVFTWGSNEFYQLGSPERKDRVYPYHVKALRYLFVIQLCTGGSHTVVLTKDGRVFTFGADSFGQLGHGRREDEERPKAVMELAGSTASKVACGRCHTLVLIDRKVYAFGLGSEGQLGLGHTSTKLTPTIITQIGEAADIFAGDDRSFVAVSDGTEPMDTNNRQITQNTISKLTLTKVRSLLSSGSVNQLLGLLESVLTSLACVNASFLAPGYSHFGAKRTNHGLMMDDLREMHELIMESRLTVRDEILRVMKKSLSWSLISELAPSPPDIEALRVFLILPWLPPFSSPSHYHSIHIPFATALLSLQKIPMQVVRVEGSLRIFDFLPESWWCSFKTRHFNRIVKVFKQVVEFILENEMNNKSFEAPIQKALEVLAILNRLNTEMPVPKLPFESFYVDSLVDRVDINSDYVKHIISGDKSFYFCRYPFILNAEAKTIILQTDANLQMQFLMQRTHQQNFQSLFTRQPMESPFLDLRINRETIVDDALSQLMSYCIQDLKKPLKVQFYGEEADDAGGVKKEFFMLLFQEILSDKYSMFVELPDSRLTWFAVKFFQEVMFYKLVGLLCGLAIYNGVLVTAGLPLALYKKLLGLKVTLEDWKELSPVEGRGLEELLEYEGDDVEDVFCLTFQVSTSLPQFDMTVTEELKPGGVDLPVTKDNRQEYVDLMVDYRLNSSVEEQYRVFEEGFQKVVTNKIIKLFQPQELREMVGGNEMYDWDEFEKGTEYKGEYWRHHPVIKNFWDCFHELSQEQKKKFLLFLTGSERIPLLGMKQLKMIIQPVEGGDDYFPVAHTCFNLLDLPKILDIKKMKRKLEEAIEHNIGFSLV